MTNTASLMDKLIEQADDERSINALQRFIARLPLPGLYSDDTQQALIIADCLIKCKKIDIDYIAAAYLKMASYPGQASLGLFRGLARDLKRQSGILNKANLIQPAAR